MENGRLFFLHAWISTPTLNEVVARGRRLEIGPLKYCSNMVIYTDTGDFMPMVKKLTPLSEFSRLKILVLNGEENHFLLKLE